MVSTYSYCRQANVENSPTPSKTTDLAADFQYERLVSGNSIRLLRIKPGDSNETLKCTMEPVEFATQPDYYALSYRWRQSTNTKPIALNGQCFWVRENLYHALRYIQLHKGECLVWVDAVCVNQTNISERNQQVQIMPHIYERAATVIVWLGNEYTVHEDLLRDTEKRQVSVSAMMPPSTKDQALLQYSGSNGNNMADQLNKNQLAERIYHDDYWRRLWIIQEIAQAVQLEVCFGNSAPWEWTSFLNFMESHQAGKDGPLELDRFRTTRRNDGWSLCDLLFKCKSAECQDSRDKIYGLVGLAGDSIDFPSMEYDKPLLKVWEDMMHYMNKTDKLPRANIMAFGALVKSLLMGSDISPVQQFLHPHCSTESLSLQQPGRKDPAVFEIEGFVVGTIIHAGPSVAEATADLAKVNAWKVQLQANYHDKPKADAESKRLFDALTRPLNSPTKNALSTASNQAARSRVCYDHVSTLKWFGELPREHESNTYKESCPKPDPDRKGPRLIQLRPRNNQPPWKLGIASRQAEKGDLVVWLPETSHAVVVRVHHDVPGHHGRRLLQVFGTAWLTDDVARVPVDHQSRLALFNPADRLAVHVNAATIFVLLAGDDAF